MNQIGPKIKETETAKNRICLDSLFFLFSPELMIKSEKLNSYTTKEGNPVFSSPQRNLNIKLYPEILYFALDGYYAYLDYHMVGKNRGDYYPFI